MDDKEREIFSRLSNYDFYEENFTTYKPEEIEITGKLIANIGFKLLTASYVMIAAGIAVIALTRNFWGIIFGLVPIALGVMAIIRIKDYRTMDIYDDSIVIYTDPSCEKAVKIPYEDIEQWSSESQANAADAIMLVLKNGLTVYKNTFQIEKATKALLVNLEKKEKRFLNQQKVREENARIIENGKTAIKKFLKK
ncbi:MAG: hypothetical protein II126_06025 [Erysipelotrichaceae bacterium]|nr:hypothetical protein [Erysipelotrichaceae bacterium]